MKKRYIMLAVTAALVFAVAAGGTLAANQVESDNDVSTPLAARNLSISLSGSDTDSDIKAVPGSEITKEKNPDIAFTVKNDGNINAFVRVTVTKYWETADDKILSADNVDVDYGADSNWLQPEKMSLFEEDEGDTDTAVFYYKQPLTEGTDSTSSLIKSITIKGEETDNTYADAVLHVDVVADGVQYAAGHDDVNADAILASWGVDATVVNGELTSVGLPE